MLFQEKYQMQKFLKTTAMSSLYFFVVYMYVPYFSPYLTTLGWSESLKGLFFATFSFMSIFAYTYAGILADRIGRYKLLMIGLVIEAITLLGYVFFDNIPALFILRIFSSMSNGAILISGQARINDDISNQKRGRINGIFQTSISIAAITAPLLGGFISDNYSFLRLFQISSVGIIATILFVLFFDYFFYDDNHKHRIRSQKESRQFNIIKQFKTILAYKELRRAITSGIVVNIAIPLSTLVFPFIIIKQMGLSNSHLSIAIFLVAFAHIFQAFFGYMTERVGKGKGILFGSIFQAVCIILMFFTTRYEILLFLIFLRSIGTSIWNVSILGYISDVGEKYNIEGRVTGVFHSISRIFTTISFIVTGFILAHITHWIFFIYGAIALIGMLFIHKTFLKPPPNENWET
ncbi:MAG: MFS transporter [Candidatus Woesearchaeota archaeon]